MARVAHAELTRNERGAVYVEFLIAFFPVFLLFLGICQVSLVSAARLVVRHAANVSARAAIVVLEDEPDAFNGEPRGVLSSSTPHSASTYQTLFQELGISEPWWLDFSPNEQHRPQNGPRMAAIRYAAYLPLAVLGPKASSAPQEDSVANAVSQNFAQKLASSLAYDRAGAVVTVHTDATSDALAPEPIARSAAVTVRVTYLYPCTIPLARVIACRTLDQLLGSQRSSSWPYLPGKDSGATANQRRLALRYAFAEDQASLNQLARADMRFAVMSAQATLPNQGAGYY